jgi:hypothetical protein
MLRRWGWLIRRAWLTSEEGWPLHVWAGLRADAEETERVEREQRQTEVRARRLAEGPVVYVGEIRTRPVQRGVLLPDLPDRPYLEDWLEELLALDNYAGDSISPVRLTVELLPPDAASESPQPPTSDRNPDDPNAE